MDIAPGIHNVITERAPAVGITNSYLVVGGEIALFLRTMEKFLRYDPTDDLFRTMYPGLDAQLGHLACNQILSHLAKLESEHRVSTSGERFTCLNHN